MKSVIYSCLIALAAAGNSPAAGASPVAGMAPSVKGPTAVPAPTFAAAPTNVPNLNPKTYNIDWETTNTKMNYTVYPGDSLEFTWTTFNSLYLMKNNQCDFTGKKATELQVAKKGGSVTYMIPLDAKTGKPMYFACQVPGHCIGGMNFKANVIAVPVPGSPVAGGSDGNAGALLQASGLLLAMLAGIALF